MSEHRPPASSSPPGRTFARGDTGPAVAEIRAKLAMLGLLAEGEGAELLDPAGALFDEATDRAVRAFQQQRGISVDGQVGSRTYHALEEARWRLGDRILFFVPARLMAGDDVAALQQRLLDMGFDCGRVDGLFGVETEQALREFQRNIGVVADGTCGPATFKALAQLSRTVVGGRPHAMRDSEAINRAGPALAGKLLIIDPGHGGPAPGAEPGVLDEGELVYELASRIEGRLTATGASAFLTRGPDGTPQGPSEEDRASFANAAGADLLLSLHGDGAAAGGHGFHVITPGLLPGWTDDVAAESGRAGVAVRDALVAAGLSPATYVGRDGLNERSDLGTLNRADVPAVMLEAGNLRNADDAALLTGEAGRARVADALTAAVTNFLTG